MEKNVAEKPKDWPINNRETRLKLINENLEVFISNPNFINREKLLSLVSIVDLNEVSNTGQVRITDYEISLLNTLYIMGKMMNLNALVSYVYLHVKNIAQTHRMIKNMEFSLCESLNINLEGIYPPVLLFNQIYLTFKEQAEREFVDVMIKFINKFFYQENNEKEIEKERMITNMLLDISLLENKELFGITRFKFEEIKRMLTCVINIHNKLGNSPNERPLTGVLKLMISNFILKSRNNNYNIEIYKYLPDGAVDNAICNNELWMNSIKNLNDKREGVMINEIFKKKNWINYEWAKKINLDIDIESYVSSFSKSKPTEELENKYGKNYFGYKTDRLNYLISPFYQMNGHKVFFSRVLSYDIIYSQEEAKKELNILFEIIDLFNIEAKEKIKFLNDIIQYWKLSFKDKKWVNEEERRYQIFLDNDIDNYWETTIEDGFLKTKSSLFIYPDFISKSNVKHSYIKEEKIKKDSYRRYNKKVLCNDCLYINFSKIYSNNKKCSVCGSLNLEYDF